jgi:chaperone modulatory protein CbpM
MANMTVLATEAVVVEVHVSFTLAALCRASGANPDIVQALVEEGLLAPTGQGPSDWQFSGAALPRARRAIRLARDLELDWPALALVMDLLAEIDRLQTFATAQTGRLAALTNGH